MFVKRCFHQVDRVRSRHVSVNPGMDDMLMKRWTRGKRDFFFKASV